MPEFTHSAHPAAAGGYDADTLSAAIKERFGWLREQKERYGSVEAVGKEIPETFKSVSREIHRLEDLQQMTDEEKSELRPFIPPGAGSGSGPGVPVKVHGWRSDHWGGPMMKSIKGAKGLVSSGTVTVPTLSGGIVPIEDRPLSMLQLIPSSGLTGTDTYAYLREETRENKAAPVAKSAEKPTSVYKVKKIEGTAQTIAHLSEPVARQDLEDEALLRAYIDGSLAAGCRLALESQILSGEGEGAELTGIANTEGIQEQAFSEGLIVTARKAVTKLEEKQIPMGVWVLSLEHWEEFETTFTSDGIFVGGTPGQLPVDRARKRLWGMPVITTTLLTGKVGYLVDFPGSTKMWEREGVRIDWSEAPEGSVEGKAGFVSNELIFRGEMRAGFGVTRPSGIVQVALQE